MKRSRQFQIHNVRWYQDSDSSSAIKLVSWYNVAVYFFVTVAPQTNAEVVSCNRCAFRNTNQVTLYLFSSNGRCSLVKPITAEILVQRETI